MLVFCPPNVGVPTVMVGDAPATVAIAIETA